VHCCLVLSALFRFASRCNSLTSSIHTMPVGTLRVLTCTVCI
jgi:hypothetical protein